MPAQAILTVDLEDWYHANYGSLLSIESAPGASGSRSYVVEHTQTLLEILDRHDYRATFFALGIVAREHPELLRTLVEHGHEIACHGDAHDQVFKLGPEGFRADLRRAKEAIELACGQTPKGFRAPSWSISPPSWQPSDDGMWPLQVLVDEGFTYDASLFPFKTYLYGVAGAPLSPHRVDLPSGASIFELPAAVAELGGRRFPFAGGFYLRLLPLLVTRFLARRHLRREGVPFMIYIHPREISTDQPRLDLPPTERFIHYFNLARNPSKLDRLLKEFSCCTVEDFLSRRRDVLPPLGSPQLAPQRTLAQIPARSR